MSTYYATTKDIPFNELVPRLAPFGITEIKERSLLRHAVGVRQARPGAVDHLARFRFAARLRAGAGCGPRPIEGGNKLAVAGHDGFICSGCGAEVCRPNRSFDDNSKCLKCWRNEETTT